MEDGEVVGSNWYKGCAYDSVHKSLEDFPDECIGFVYKVRNSITGKVYIGKKILRTKRTRKPLKGYKRKRVDYVESNWKTYKGSSDITKAWDMADCFRSILFLCTRKDEMTYYETMAIIEEGFGSDKLVNSNILGKFYKKTVQEKFGKLVY